jgi:hypothetical protein
MRWRGPFGVDSTRRGRVKRIRIGLEGIEQTGRRIESRKVRAHPHTNSLRFRSPRETTRQAIRKKSIQHSRLYSDKVFGHVAEQDWIRLGDRPETAVL